MEEHIQRVDASTREDRRITLAQVAAIVGINYGTAQAIVLDGFDHCYVYVLCLNKQAVPTRLHERVES